VSVKSVVSSPSFCSDGGV